MISSIFLSTDIVLTCVDDILNFDNELKRDFFENFLNKRPFVETRSMSCCARQQWQINSRTSIYSRLSRSSSSSSRKMTRKRKQGEEKLPHD
jgi:hypothetical protein